MKQQRINELNNLYAVPTDKVYKVKRNALKSILKRFILSDLFIKVFVYTSAFILTLLLTLEI
jgi:hypothetical protein